MVGLLPLPVAYVALRDAMMRRFALEAAWCRRDVWALGRLDDELARCILDGDLETAWGLYGVLLADCAETYQSAYLDCYRPRESPPAKGEGA